MKTFWALLLVAAPLAIAPLPAGAAMAASTASPTCQGVRATIVGTAGDDHLVGTSGRDVIVGLAGDDTIEARGGRDLVCGGAGADRLEGGPGADRLYGEVDAVNASSGEQCAHGDGLDGGDGDDLLDPGHDSRRDELGCGPLDQLRFRHGDGRVRVNLERGLAAGQGRDTLVVDQALEVVGSDLGDVLLGTARSEEFDPRGGKDTVVAGNGRDRVIEGLGKTGNDTYDLGDGRDTVVTHTGHDDIRTGTDDDVVIALNAVRIGIDAGHGADEITRYAVPGQERVSGGEGPDLLAVVLEDGTGPMVLDIPAGTLTVDGGIAVVEDIEHWTFAATRDLDVTGSDEPETVELHTRGSAAYALTARMAGGDDQAYAEGGDDVVDGGDGVDYADLGEGADTCEGVEDGPC